MAQQEINVGAAPNDGTGDPWRDALIKINANETELFGLVASGQRVIVSKKADFPAPSAGVIILAASTQYFLTESVSLGTDRIVMSDSSAITGIESTITTLTYTGTGDMLTMSNVTARVNNITLSAALGRVYNWSDSSVKIGRFNDVTVSACQKIGLFSGTSGILRFTNHSVSSAAVDGLEFAGNFRSLLYEVAAVTMTAGAVFNLGTATFDSFISTFVLATINGTSNFVSGAASSANINVGGQGSLLTNLTSGTGTPLAGVTNTDARWKMAHNDDIADTSRTMSGRVIGNATVTAIVTASTPVKVNFGTNWVAGKQEQWTSDNTGTHTYNGPDESFHVTGSINATNASGVSKTFRWYIAKNGTIDLNSVSQGIYDSTRAESIAITGAVDVTSGDTIELYVENVTDPTDITAATANLVLED